MADVDRPMIVGAGPVGLGAALLLAMQGGAPRVVEMRDEPSPLSKALAVNPRTLDILEPSGLTREILELGKPIRGVRFHRRGRVIAALSFAGIHPKYPFLIALSQAAMERLLARALEAAGGVVERGVRMVECRNVGEGVEVSLETADGAREVVRCPWLLAADGARSVARDALGVDFPGSMFPREWHLADAPLETAVDDDHADVFFADRGEFQFRIRVIDEALKDRSDRPIWRVIGNRPEPLGRLIEARQTSPAVWSSSFRVSHRIIKTLATGAVYFAGDAAHIHSPIGARGMNLGLEDAWVFARLVKADQLQRYDQLRRPVVRQVVDRVELLSRIASGESRFYRFVRTFVLPRAIGIPFVRARMVSMLTGLDHELPADAAGASGIGALKDTVP